MFALLLLAIGFYLYKTGDLQKFFGKSDSQYTGDDQARKIIDLRYAAGKISEEEYAKLKNLI
ncbi:MULTISPECIES: hypothetical protein [Bacillaceae]|jgi:uncharacterized membrane protein|uniref:hypothetical protein n=1 Tax=Bacillaceae TaxID=186817 RepID=UPI00177E9CDA|nr:MULTISPECIES: hypothetical protein [Bacillaceae]MBT2679604.1 hypothetical protein [Bacillus sp. ISL-35]MBT2703509.1 hypothetical protein [Chryseobacterium sp. ISL-80]MCM3576137.1 hypothetical protein [Mesobacillus subterraneus]UYZ19990.1 hypothetical protein FOF60_12890 [Mesobacillus jeotgali]